MYFQHPRYVLNLQVATWINHWGNSTSQFDGIQAQRDGYPTSLEIEKPGSVALRDGSH